MKKRIDCLDFLKAVLVLAVLVEHYFGTVCFEGVSRQENPALYWFSSLSSGFFGGQSVPVYFFISGYLFFLSGRFSMADYVRKLRRRINSLFVPYIIWNTLAVLLLITVLLSPLASMMKYGAEINFSLSNLLSSYWIYDGSLAGVNVPRVTSPINMPLWYVRDLMIMVVLSPAICWLLRKTGVVFLVAACCLWICFSIKSPLIYFPKDALFFFSLGAYFSLKGRVVTTLFSRFLKPSMFLYLLLGTLTGIAFYYEVGNAYWLKFLNTLVGVVFSIALAEHLSHGNIINATRKYFGAALFIYLSHGLICSKMIKVMIILLRPSADLGYIMCDVLSYIISILLLLFIYKMLERVAPRVLKVMIGKY